MKNLTTVERNHMVQKLLEGSEGGKLRRGIVVAVAEFFEVSRSTVYFIWNEALKQKEAGLPIVLASKKIGCKKSTAYHFEQEIFTSIPINKRRTVRSTAKATGYSKSFIGRLKKQGLIRAHTNAIKPKLSDVHKITRLKFCIEALMFDVRSQNFKFKSMSNTIHMDEKWFNNSDTTLRCYLGKDEAPPYRACQSKTHMDKIMFNCAVSRPIYANDGQLLFDGKIGIWSFATKEPAMRNSKNRPRGTLVTKQIPAITKDVTRDMLINKVIPAIQAKWPAILSKDINIQWDNARPHITNDDPYFRAAADKDGFNINLVFQPANSPDTNVNDLGYFRSIQSLKADKTPNTIDELVDEVQTSFAELDHVTLNKVFLSLQGCMKEIMIVKGGNDYDLPHQQKDAHLRLGDLPTDLQVHVGLVRECLIYLKEVGHSEGFEEMMNQLEV